MTSTKKEQAKRRASLRPHPVRDQIVDIMRSYGKPISPMRISRITGGTLGSVAYHVRTLSAAGVIELADEGRVRGAVVHHYALVSDDAPLAYFYAWARVLRIVDGPDAVHRRSIARDELRRTPPYVG